MNSDPEKEVQISETQLVEVEGHKKATPPKQRSCQNQTSVVYCKRCQVGVVSQPEVKLHEEDQKEKQVESPDREWSVIF